MLKLKYGDKVKRDTNQTVIGVEIKWLKEHARSAIHAIMVGLYSDQAIAIVKNVEINFYSAKTEEELLRVDANYRTVSELPQYGKKAANDVL